MAQKLKRLPAMRETWVQSLGWEAPLEKEMQPILVFLPGESHGARSLVGYSPRGPRELDTTERLHFHFPFMLITRKNILLYVLILCLYEMMDIC